MSAQRGYELRDELVEKLDFAPNFQKFPEHEKVA